MYRSVLFSILFTEWDVHAYLTRWWPLDAAAGADLDPLTEAALVPADDDELVFSFLRLGCLADVVVVVYSGGDDISRHSVLRTLRGSLRYDIVSELAPVCRLTTQLLLLLSNNNNYNNNTTTDIHKYNGTWELINDSLCQNFSQRVIWATSTTKYYL